MSTAGKQDNDVKNEVSKLSSATAIVPKRQPSGISPSVGQDAAGGSEDNYPSYAGEPAGDEVPIPDSAGKEFPSTNGGAKAVTDGETVDGTPDDGVDDAFLNLVGEGTENLESAKAAGVAAAAQRAAEANATAQDRGSKRSRDEVETPGAIYAPPSLYTQPQLTSNAAAVQQLYAEPPKRPRQNCYKCGGSGHIAVMCTSRPGSTEGPGAIECRVCTGRGHMARECPSALSRDQCFRCGQIGHRGRECPTNAYGGDPSYGGPTGLPGHPGQQFGQQPAYGGPDMYGQAYPMAMGGFPPQGFAMPVPQARVGFFRPPPGSGKCFRCGEEGHWTRDCPMKPADSDPNGCYKCGRAGHRARDCNVCYRCMQPGHLAAHCPTSAS